MNKQGDTTHLTPPVLGFPGTLHPMTYYFIQATSSFGALPQRCFYGISRLHQQFLYPQSGYFAGLCANEKWSSAGPWEVLPMDLPE